MDLKTLDQASIKARDMYNQAESACRLLPPEQALFRMVEVVKAFPDLAPAREKLREMELGLVKAGKKGGLSAAMKTALKLGKIKKLTAVSPVEAMAICEDLLALDLNNPKVLDALADAAMAAEAEFAALEAMAILRRLYPKDEKIAAKLQVVKERHAKVTGAQDMKGADSDAVKQQLMDASVHDADRANLLIEHLLRDLRTGDSLETRRKLADAYMVACRYEEAHQEYRIIADRIGTMDPVIDKAIERAHVAEIDQSLEMLRANPEAYENSDLQIQDLESYRAGYRLKRAIKRSETYPKDAMLHFELAELYYEMREYKLAMDEFKLAGRSLQKEGESRFYIGRCLYERGDIARGLEVMDEFVEQLEAGRIKLNGLYVLANYHKAQGNDARWLELLRAIVLQSPRFLDAAALVKAYEAEHPEALVEEKEEVKDKNADIF